MDGLVKAAGFTVHGVPAAHESLDREGQGRSRFLGNVVQFEPFAMYHSGDTVCHYGMARRFNIDVALLPITFKTAPPDEFVATCRTVGQRVIRYGERSWQ